MGKKKVKAPRPRTDAERRSRQCERMARMLRTLKCIMGPGRWDAQALAQELECSTRTVQRILQTLSMAGSTVSLRRRSEGVSRATRLQIPRLGNER